MIFPVCYPITSFRTLGNPVESDRRAGGWVCSEQGCPSDPRPAAAPPPSWRTWVDSWCHMGPPLELGPRALFLLLAPVSQTCCPRNRLAAWVQHPGPRLTGLYIPTNILGGLPHTVRMEKDCSRSHPGITFFLIAHERKSLLLCHWLV